MTNTSPAPRSCPDSHPTGAAPRECSATGTVVLVGAVHEARPALDVLLADPRVHLAMVVTRTPEGAGRLSGAVELAGPATDAGVPVVRSDDANDPAVVAAVRACAPDLLVVVGWTQLIKPELLAVPRRGCIGFHASLLPRHRGHSPVNWAILRGETLTGNTMMLLAPGADTGDIVDQRAIPISPDDTCATVYQRVGEAGAAMLTDNLADLIAGTARRRPQRPDEGDVLPRRTPEMGVIDWDQPARRVHDWVRALTHPYPGAFTALDGRQLMVWATRTPEGDTPAGRPGEVLALEENGIRVGVRDGSILVTHVSMPGRTPHPAMPWATRSGLGVGVRFDSVPRRLAQWARGEGPRPVGAQ
ncbi:methionyl-tRNA formyltransferase [Oryzihumus leptocrescens]|uniref:Methionyl-tRNA formyltransferase n=1 Tax=Oryzihumus leptocrescens TaxID=297536 RepID=A0A542Z9D1_9MICO|nr:methionyl-tRNA formyltransferase [Oryzihumus leptocrescens]TQL56915.1 methionyl-tRNA formyltransferase [Oryzihumus leptocrescens]